MITQNQCLGLMGRLFGHKFKPRYNSNVNPGVSTKIAEMANRSNEFIDIWRSVELDSIRRIASELSDTDKEYVQDVCVRCGQVAIKPNFNANKNVKN